MFALLFSIVLTSSGLVHSTAANEEIGVYELSKGNLSLKFTNWGATLMSLSLPDKKGKTEDIVLGYDSVNDYKNDTTYFGAIVGRVANRIAGGQFTLNGTRYKVLPNEGNNTLHGGPVGFSDVAWMVEEYHNGGPNPYIVFVHHSPDNEEGFPGHLVASVTYKLTGEYKLSVIMKGIVMDKPTPINLAQHTYFNLGGHNNGDILSTRIKIFGSHITPVDNHLIPTGKIASVVDTPYDLLKLHTIGSKIKALPKGYDINYVLDEGHLGHNLKRAAIVEHKESGRRMELFTNQPGLQFYTGNMLKDVKGKGGVVYKVHAGLCLETQGFPDSVNHRNFPSQILSPGQVYHHFMLYRFSIDQV